MISLANVAELRFRQCFSRANLPTKRLASLTGAIRRGARKSRNAVERTERYKPRDDVYIDTALEGNQGRGPRPAAASERQYVSRRQAEPEPVWQRKDSKVGQKQNSKDSVWNAYRLAQGRDSGLHTPQMKGDGFSFSMRTPARESFLRVDNRDHEEGAMRRPEKGSLSARSHMSVPLSIPRSSASSEFIYGRSTVHAALQARTRKLYNLYTYQGANGIGQQEGDDVLSMLAQKHGIKVKPMSGDSLRLLDKMANGRPHNGYILEASPLPKMPAQALERVTRRGDGFSFTAGYQSAEEISVNGNSHRILGSSRRYPFVLMLDSIQDPGNLGAIIRSAAFFGVDAVALLDHNLAPFSPVTLKASAGAAEYMSYLRIKNDHDFVKTSKSNGWKFFAAIAPDSASASRGGLSAVRLEDAEEALMKWPCVLMLGGEGEGLRPRLQNVADGKVSVHGAAVSASEFGLDSLNVSVAAALLMQTFVKRSNAHAGTERAGRENECSGENGRLF